MAMVDTHTRRRDMCVPSRRSLAGRTWWYFSAGQKVVAALISVTMVCPALSDCCAANGFAFCSLMRDFTAAFYVR
jgi:hypothetical protein